MKDIGLAIAFIFGCLTIYYTSKDYKSEKITRKNYVIATVLESVVVISALLMIITF